MFKNRFWKVKRDIENSRTGQLNRQNCMRHKKGAENISERIMSQWASTRWKLNAKVIINKLWIN